MKNSNQEVVSVSLEALVAAGANIKKEKDVSKIGITKRREEEFKAETIQEALSQITSDVNDITNIVQMLPDLLRIGQIHTATILSPKDLLTPPFKLKVDHTKYNGAFEQKTIDTINKHFVEHVKFEKNMPEIVNEALMSRGAWIYLMMPPAEIEAIARFGGQLTHESYSQLTTPKSLGLVNPENKLSDFGLTITDDPRMLRAGQVNSVYAKQCRDELTHEAYGVPSLSSLPSLGGNGASTTMDLSKLSDLVKEEREKAHNILIKLPIDCCWPLHEPGDPSNHLDYIVLTDEKGNFLSNIEGEDYMAQLEQRLDKLFDQGSKDNFYQVTKDTSYTSESTPARKAKKFWASYQDKLFEELESSIIVDGDKANIAIERFPGLCRVILNRALANQKTRMIIVPSSYISYFAFNYNSFGIGESLITRTKLLASFRAVVQMAKLKGAVTNSIPSQEVRLTLDENEKDPIGILSMTAMQMGKMDIASLPVGTFNPSNIFAGLARAGIRLKVDGAGVMPNTNIDYNDVSRSVTLPDSDFTDELKRMHYLGLQITPDLIDQTLQGEFATGLITGHMLYIKERTRDQDKFIEDASSFVHKYIRLDKPLLDEVVSDVGMDNAIQFIRALTLSLPTADMSIVENQANAYRTYSDFVDEVMETVWTDEMLEGMLDGEYLPGTTRAIKQVIAGKIKRDYLARENIMPEIWEAILGDDEARELFATETTLYHENMIKMSGSFVAVLKKASAKVEAMLTKKLTAVDGETPTDVDTTTDDVTDDTTDETADETTDDTMDDFENLDDTADTETDTTDETDAEVDDTEV